MALRTTQSDANRDVSPTSNGHSQVQSRSRNGCITCRIRRVKCDEQQPHCRRCQSTGRKCDGYLPQPKSQQAKALAPSVVRIIQHTPRVVQPTQMWMFHAVDKLLTEDEYRSLEFFNVQTISCFGERAGGSLLNAACQDPGVRLAAMALGTMHRVVLHHHMSPPHVRRRGMQLALQQYNLAIRRGLTNFPRNSDGPADSILSMCVLFFCFESLQGHFRAALQHAAAGLRILAQRKLGGRPEENTLLPPDVVYSMFAALEGQILEIDGRSPLSDGHGLLVRCARRQPLWTLEEASGSFRRTYNDFLRLMSFSSKLEEPHNEVEIQRITGQILARYHEVQADVDAWSLDFDHFLANFFSWDRADRASQQLVRVLQLWRNMLSVVLHMGWPPKEGAWDSYLSEFTTILDLAEEIVLMSHPADSPCLTPKVASGSPIDEHVSSHSRENSPPRHDDSAPTTYAKILPRPFRLSPSRFSMALGILPVLWTVATQCRDSGVRYRAIDLIGRSKRREGVWDSDLYFRLALHIAHREEQAADLGLGAEYTAVAIPPKARVTIEGILEEGRKAKITYIRESIRFNEEILQW